eukprot:7158068-Heterocapsa_arctica.AAC.1
MEKDDADRLRVEAFNRRRKYEPPRTQAGGSGGQHEPRADGEQAEVERVEAAGGSEAAVPPAGPPVAAPPSRAEKRGGKGENSDRTEEAGRARVECEKRKTPYEEAHAPGLIFRAAKAKSAPPRGK